MFQKVSEDLRPQNLCHEDIRRKDPPVSKDALERVLLRLRLLQSDMCEVLGNFDVPPANLHRNIEHWALALENIMLQAGSHETEVVPSMQDLLVLALSGMSVTADAQIFSLHELTQLAAALRAHAKLIVLNSTLMTPIERDCIKTVQPNQVVFQ